MEASVCSFSLSSSSDEKTANPANTAARTSDSATKDPINVSAKTADSGTITNDPKETADSADSGFNFPNNSAKKGRRRRVFFLLVISFLFPMIMALPLHKYHDVIVRSLFEGSTEFQIHSASLSTFSTTPWWSQRITADGNISLCAKNIFIHETINYDVIEVSVFHNDTRLSSNVLPSFNQVPGDELLLNVNFSAEIDTSAVADFLKSDDSVSLNVVIRGTVSQDKSKNWSKNFIASCKNVELQFLAGTEKAEMKNEGPIKCESH